MASFKEICENLETHALEVGFKSVHVGWLNEINSVTNGNDSSIYPMLLIKPFDIEVAVVDSIYSDIEVEMVALYYSTFSSLNLDYAQRIEDWTFLHNRLTSLHAEISRGDVQLQALGNLIPITQIDMGVNNDNTLAVAATFTLRNFCKFLPAE